MEHLITIGTKAKTSEKRSRSFFQSDRVDVCKSFFFQPKLTIGPVDDPYEREADAVADKVMRMSDHNEEQVQPKISSIGVHRKCAECEEEEKLQKKESRKGSAEVPSIVYDVVNSSGNSLDPVVKASMENRFGYNFGNVKIHTDSLAAKSAQSINALAYTSGSNIVFNEGQYSPGTERGQHLLAHELTHVLQQHTEPWRIQRQVPPATIGTQSDEIVNALIADALSRNNGDVEQAFYDLQKRRCLPESCGDENLAAAEHYMFARHMVQDTTIIPSSVWALFMAGAISAYQVAKLLGVVPSLCPEICPVTPPSFFQFRWEMNGVGDALIVTAIPSPPFN